MAQETNLNVSPYFDDFDASKDFHKVLFKPGLPIQARELTTLQSILQNQVEQVGTHLFKEGSCVIPGQINFNNNMFAVEVEPNFLGNDVEGYGYDLINEIVTGSNSKVKALTLAYELESVKKDLIREKGNYQSLKEDMVNFETTNQSLREDINDLKFQNLEDKVFLLEKIVRLYEDKPKSITSYSNGVSTNTTGG